MTSILPAPSPALVPLCRGTLRDLPATVEPPGYPRERLQPSVVHIGVGAFHRAHQAVYLDDLARLGVTGWGVIGVGLHHPELGEVLARQDGLYLTVERHASGDRARVVGAMVGYLYAPDDRAAVLDVLADPGTRLVTLTITDSGYCIDAETRELVPDDETTSDLADRRRPTGVLGHLVEALDRRRRSGAGPFTILSCDNLVDNGAVARTAVVSFAALVDPDLAAWIDRHVTFPGSMVDRITPVTSPQDRDEVVEALGVDDAWPVVTEPYRRWVVEDSFCNGRPPLDRVGVQLVDDVGPHQMVKTRLLNASHCALGFLGSLAGHTTTVEALAEPVFRHYLTALTAWEIAPLLPEVAGLDVEGYRRETLARLLNPRLGDQLTRLTRRGQAKVAQHLVPSLTEAVRAGRPHRLLLLAVAGWVVLETEEPHGASASGPVLATLGVDQALEDELRGTVEALLERGPRDLIRQYLTSAEGAS
jgi:fructuronate reductase/mannitol 2-dehydrogenase